MVRTTTSSTPNLVDVAIGAFRALDPLESARSADERAQANPKAVTVFTLSADVVQVVARSSFKNVSACESPEK